MYLLQAEQATAAVNQALGPMPPPAVAASNMPFSSGRERLGAMSPIPQAPDAVPLDSLTEADLKARDLLEVDTPGVRPCTHEDLYHSALMCYSVSAY